MSYGTSRSIELPCVIAAVLWVASVTLFGAAGIVGATTSSRHLANMTIGGSLIVAVVACCATVRVMLINHYRVVKAAFDYGVEVGEERAATVPLQRVP